MGTDRRLSESRYITGLGSTGYPNATEGPQALSVNAPVRSILGFEIFVFYGPPDSILIFPSLLFGAVRLVVLQAVLAARVLMVTPSVAYGLTAIFILTGNGSWEGWPK